MLNLIGCFRFSQQQIKLHFCSNVASRSTEHDRTMFSLMLSSINFFRTLLTKAVVELIFEQIVESFWCKVHL